jgi:hypothetical protein
VLKATVARETSTPVAVRTFASDVMAKFTGVSDTSRIEELDVSLFMMPSLASGEHNYGFPMNRESLESYKVAPPEGLSWDDLDHLSCFGSFSPGTHIWLFLDGRHYDAEAPEGVGSFYELPFFQRYIASWVADGCPRLSVQLPKSTFGFGHR